MRSRILAGFAGLILSAGLLGVPVAAAGTAPAPAGSPRAVALSSSQIQFTWTENSNQTNFQVTDGVSYVTLSAAARSYTWSGLAANTYKCSSVRAYNSYGSSAWSSWACTSSLPSIPAVPGNISAVALNSSQINVTWTESSNQTGFQVSDGVSTVSVGAGVRNYTWSGLAPNTYKCTHVRAYNAGGYSAWTGWACTSSLSSVPAVPAVPGNISAVALNSSQINVTWTESSNQTGFQVYDGVSIVNVGASVRNYIWSGLVGGTYKCTFVRAYNAGGYSAWSAQACTSTPPSTVPQPLTVPYLSQYQGQATETVDCGPAAVAMVLQYRGLRPGGLTNTQWVSEVRTRSGASDTGCDGGPCGTYFPQLEAALSYYGATWSEIPASLTPAPDAQVTAIKNALAAGKPVIAFVHGADLGRGTPLYGDHWFVVTGFSSDGNTAYINDPDNQPARDGYPNWIVGGQITLPTSTLRTALYNAAAGPYAIIVN